MLVLKLTISCRIVKEKPLHANALWDQRASQRVAQSTLERQNDFPLEEDGCSKNPWTGEINGAYYIFVQF